MLQPKKISRPDTPLAETPIPKDSTVYFRNKVKEVNEKIKKVIPNLPRFISNDKNDNKKSQEMRNLVSEKNKAISNQLRQSDKGKIGYDKNGYKIK